MKDTWAMAYVNMYGVLGALENLCALDAVAREILAALKRPVSLCFDVKDGPCCTFHFSREGCRMEEGRANCTCRMRFSSPEAFNALIDRSKPGLPVKGIGQLLALTGPFTQLTNRLTALLRPSEEALRERAFLRRARPHPVRWLGPFPPWPTRIPSRACRPRIRWMAKFRWACGTLLP